MSTRNEYLVDRLEIIERYIILLLGVVVERPIKSKIHLQKELFILSKIVPKLSRILTFEKHYYGPCSEDLQDLITNPLYYDGAYVCNNDGSISLTERGKKIFNKIVEENKDEPRFNQFINLLTLTRELYDKLTQEELLFLMYITYPEFKERLEISERLLSKEKRKEIARSLLKKGLITEERYNEIIEE